MKKDSTVGVGWPKIVAALLAFLVVIFLGAEIWARSAGVGDYALYERSEVVGYIPRANQQGTFLNKYHWVFNERHMGTGRPFSPGRQDVLLIGDSIVLGGNQVDQPDKLGPQLESEWGCPVWPIAAGSWALNNELAELFANPDFLKVPTLVFVLNSGDFGAASVWSSELTHPTHYSPSALVYAARRKLRGQETTTSRPSSTAAERWRAGLRQLMANYRGRVIWVLYPNRQELREGADRFGELEAAVGDDASLVKIAGNPSWKPEFYRDSIHPSVSGNRALAQIIGSHLPPCEAHETLRHAAPPGSPENRGQAEVS